MSLVGLCWFIPDDDLDTTFPTFHLQVICWKESLALNPLAEAHSPPPSTQHAGQILRCLGCWEKLQKVSVAEESRSPDKWLVVVTGGWYIDGVGWVVLWAAGRMGEAACQDPGIVQNSFPAELIRQRIKKASWKGSMVLPSRWEVWASRLGNSESTSFSRASPSCPWWEVPAGTWGGHLAMEAWRVEQCSALERGGLGTDSSQKISGQ